MTATLLQPGEAAEFESQMFSFAHNFNGTTVVEFTTEYTILPNCCCALVLFLLL
jgi:hypothetical protein